MERVQANRGLRRLFPHDRMDPFRAVGRDMRQQSGSGGPERVEEQRQGVLVAAFVRPHEPTGVVVDHAGEVSVSFPVGDFVDPDAGEAVELIGFTGEVLHDPGDDRRDGPPGQPQEHRHRRQCHVLGQPRAGVLQQVGAFRAGPGPRHVRHQHTVVRALHPRRRGLQERARGTGVHRPPPPGPDAGVIPRARPSALRAPAPGPGVRAYRHDQDLAVAVRVRLHRHVADDHALDAHQLPEYPGLAHAVSLSVVPVYQQDQNYGRARHVAPKPLVRHPLQRHKSLYFVGPTGFNLLGLDRWVRHFNYITYYDAWDGAHPRMITPRLGREAEFTSSEDIVNFLLRHPEVQVRL